MLSKPFDKRFVHLDGKLFRYLTVLSYSHFVPRNKGRRHYWKCRCNCGRETVVQHDNLVGGKTISCGCQMNRVKSNLTGMRFGRLTAIEHVGSSKWRCVCDCGAIRIVVSKSLKNGATKSCGCYRRDTVGPKISAAVKTHGMSKTATYNSWCAMIGRCTNRKNVKYKDYGGRGIRICDQWRSSFESFYRDMGEKPSPKHSIGRIDNDGNYEPGNCRWETAKEQGANTRLCKRILADGVEKTLSQCARELGMCVQSLWSRIDRGWPIEEALKTPKLSRCRRPTYLKHARRPAQQV